MKEQAEADEICDKSLSIVASLVQKQKPTTMDVHPRVLTFTARRFRAVSGWNALNGFRLGSIQLETNGDILAMRAHLQWDRLSWPILPIVIPMVLATVAGTTGGERILPCALPAWLLWMVGGTYAGMRARPYDLLKRCAGEIRNNVEGLERLSQKEFMRLRKNPPPQSL